MKKRITPIEQEYKTLCSCHKRIMYLARQIESYFSDISCQVYVHDVKEFRNIDLVGKEIEALAELAYDYGNRMEDRLKKYKKGIERLGFKRNG